MRDPSALEDGLWHHLGDQLERLEELDHLCAAREIDDGAERIPIAGIATQQHERPRGRRDGRRSPRIMTSRTWRDTGHKAL